VNFKTLLTYSWEWRVKYSQKIIYKMLIFYYINEVEIPTVGHVIYVFLICGGKDRRSNFKTRFKKLR